MFWRSIALVGIVIGAAWFVSAADAPVGRAAFIAPFIDNETVAVAYHNVEKFDGTELVKQFATALNAPAAEAAVMQLAVSGFQQSFRNAGCTEMWSVIRPSNPADPVFHVLPVGANAKAEQLVELINRLDMLPSKGKHAVINGAIVIGSIDTLERLKKGKPGALPAGWSDALAAIATAESAVVLVPSADHRRVIEEMLPTLPKELGGGSSKVLTNGLRWLALTIAAPPKLGLNLTVQSADAPAAQALVTLTQRSLTALGEVPLPITDRPLKEADAEGYATIVKLLTPTANGSQVTVAVPDLAPGLTAVGKLLKSTVGTASERAISQNNLKQIVLAMHNYHDAYGKWPSNVVDKDGKALLSWRVLLLPYMEQDALFKQFKLDEPWDSEHNKKLLGTVVKVYRSPRQTNGNELTTYLAPALENSLFPTKQPKNGVRLQDVTDGTSNTIAVVEVGDEVAVPWTKPEDYTPPAQDPIKPLLSHFGKGFHAAMADGSVRFISAKIDAKTLLALFTRNGGEVTGDIP